MLRILTPTNLTQEGGVHLFHTHTSVVNSQIRCTETHTPTHTGALSTRKFVAPNILIALDCSFWTHDMFRNHKTRLVIPRYVLSAHISGDMSRSLDRSIVQSRDCSLARSFDRSLARSVDHSVARSVARSNMSCDHKTCLVITRHVLWSQDMSRDHKTCLVITRHVLWSQDTARDHKTCLVITKHVSWSQHMSCDHRTFLVITKHVCDHKTCLGITRHVLWSQAMFCDPKTCPVITRRISWSEDISSDQEGVLFVLNNGLRFLPRHGPRRGWIGPRQLASCQRGPLSGLKDNCFRRKV